SSLLQTAGGLKRISAAVFVAQRFEGTGATRKALPRTPEELDRLRRIVQSSLGIQENDGEETRGDIIALEEIAFNDQPAAELTQQFDEQQKRQFWVDLGLKLIYPALGVGILFLFWRGLKGVKIDEIPIGVSVGPGNENGNGN